MFGKRKVVIAIVGASLLTVGFAFAAYTQTPAPIFSAFVLGICTVTGTYTAGNVFAKKTEGVAATITLPTNEK